MNPRLLNNLILLNSFMKQYHPLVIEGMGGSRDTRDPTIVAERIISNLHRHWETTPTNKPTIVITQGDPHTPTGISAITRIVANELGVSRMLVVLDEDIDPNHTIDADRENVIYESTYSTLTSCLLDDDETTETTTLRRLTHGIDARLVEKNARLVERGEKPLKSWYRDYALLQEVTKVALKHICDGITVAHTYDGINEFSVTSFYEVGLELGLIDRSDMLSFTPR